MKKILSTLLATSIIVPGLAMASPAKTAPSNPGLSYNVKSYYISDDSYAKHGANTQFATEDNYLSGSLNKENYKITHELTRGYVASISNGTITPGSVTYGTDVLYNKDNIVIKNSTFKINDYKSGEYSIELPDISMTTQNISLKDISGKVIPLKINGGYELLTISA